MATKTTSGKPAKKATTADAAKGTPGRRRGAAGTPTPADPKAEIDAEIDATVRKLEQLVRRRHPALIRLNVYGECANEQQIHFADPDAVFPAGLDEGDIRDRRAEIRGRIEDYLSAIFGHTWQVADLNVRFRGEVAEHEKSHVWAYNEAGPEGGAA
jgi:hypothetical protein